MTKTPTLDPRRSRKLTSRECCSVLGGYLGGMCTSNLIGVQAARDALRLWVEDDMPWNHIRKLPQEGSRETARLIEEARALQADDADPALRMFWRGLGAVIAGLRAVAPERAVKTAAAWLYETDAFWPEKK